MKFSQITTVRVGHLTIAEVEVTREFAENRGAAPERSSGWAGNGALPINPDLVTPILAEAVKRSIYLSPSKFSFESGQDLEVNRDIGSYEGTQGLREYFPFKSIIQIVFGVAAQTEAFNPQNIGPGGVFARHVSDILKENWEKHEVPAQ